MPQPLGHQRQIMKSRRHQLTENEVVNVLPAVLQFPANRGVKIKFIEPDWVRLLARNHEIGPDVVIGHDGVTIGNVLDIPTRSVPARLAVIGGQRRTQLRRPLAGQRHQSSDHHADHQGQSGGPGRGDPAPAGKRVRLAVHAVGCAAYRSAGKGHVQHAGRAQCRERQHRRHIGIRHVAVAEHEDNLDQQERRDHPKTPDEKCRDCGDDAGTQQIGIHVQPQTGHALCAATRLQQASARGPLEELPCDRPDERDVTRPLEQLVLRHRVQDVDPTDQRQEPEEIAAHEPPVTRVAILPEQKVDARQEHQGRFLRPEGERHEDAGGDGCPHAAAC